VLSYQEDEKYQRQIAERLIEEERYDDALEVVAQEPFPEAEKYWRQIVDRLIEEDRYNDALKVIAQKPKKDWKDQEYLYGLDLYVKLGVFDLAYEMLTKLRKRKGLEEVSDLYYDFALSCEQAVGLRRLQVFIKNSLTNLPLTRMS